MLRFPAGVVLWLCLSAAMMTVNCRHTGNKKHISDVGSIFEETLEEVKSTQQKVASLSESSHPHGRVRRQVQHSADNDVSKEEERVIKQQIIDGTATHPETLKWNVALVTTDLGFICGGTLIDKLWVLTAAHCVYMYSAINTQTIFAMVGAWNLSAHDAVDNVTVSQIIVYPNYTTEQTSEFDVAMLKLEREVNINDTAKFIIQLPQPLFNLFALNPNCIITGWGATDPSDTQALSPVLTKRRVSVITHVACQQRWDQTFTRPSIYNTNICVDEGLDGDISACNGDSGSPLQCFDEYAQVWRIAGLSSWGSGACTTYPSVYIRVQMFLPWIKTQLTLTQLKTERENQQVIIHN